MNASDVLDGRVLRRRPPIRPLPLFVLGLLSFPHGGDLIRGEAGAPRAVEGEDHDVDPFLDVVAARAPSIAESHKPSLAKKPTNRGPNAASYSQAGAIELIPTANIRHFLA